jgi:hypothetical protein
MPAMILISFVGRKSPYPNVVQVTIEKYRQLYGSFVSPLSGMVPGTDVFGTDVSSIPN